MIPLCDRRSACFLAQNLLLSSLNSETLVLPRFGERITSSATITTSELAQFVVTHTPRTVLEAVKDSGGKFLYRGEEARDSCYQEQVVVESTTSSTSLLVRICNPPPDLLMAETYDYDPVALDYFQRLETSLTQQFAIIAKPSIGHIATSDPQEAGNWGNVVSIWPLELQSNYSNNKNNFNPQAQPPQQRFSFVWPADRSVFYANETKNNTQNDATALVANARLRTVLEAKEGREVLFASFTNGRQSSAVFLAIPAELDNALREELERIGYGL